MQMDIEGMQLTVNGSATPVSSSGQTSVKGAIVMIN